ncbi:MAG: hypothetical protein NW205_04330 [Hyphomicrobiaceae bacterium]|nr:hypothetical protein [Hyphomicrobiaceae bacterium]
MLHERWRSESSAKSHLPLAGYCSNKQLSDRPAHSEAGLLREIAMALGRASPVFAERHLIIANEVGTTLRSVKIRLHYPELIKTYNNIADDADWQVMFEVVGLSSEGSIYKGQAVQVDAIGALIQAMQRIAVYVRTSESYRLGRLYWLAPGDNCGLPFLDGPEYEAVPSSSPLTGDR